MHMNRDLSVEKASRTLMRALRLRGFLRWVRKFARDCTVNFDKLDSLKREKAFAWASGCSFQMNKDLSGPFEVAFRSLKSSSLESFSYTIPNLCRLCSIVTSDKLDSSKREKAYKRFQRL
jgi:hypothetical protein